MAAHDLGSTEPPRHALERLIREAAAHALSEADLVRLAHELSVRLILRIDSADPGVVAYSAVLSSLPSQHQREFGGKDLACDLTLDYLHETWGSPSGLSACATWRKYTGIAARTDPQVAVHPV